VTTQLQLIIIIIIVTLAGIPVLNILFIKLDTYICWYSTILFYWW